MKILIIGALGEGALEHYYLRGLKKAGVECEAMDVTAAYYGEIEKSVLHKAFNKIIPEFFFKPINRNLLAGLAGKRYDVIIVFKGLTLFPDTIRKLKSCAKLLCCYNPDHPYEFYSPGSGNKNILDSINLYDLYITYSVQISAGLKKRFGVESFVLPFGYDDSIAIPPSQNKATLSKFAFIGAYDAERNRMLEQLRTDDLVIFGDSKWGTRTKPFSRTRKAYTGRSLFNQEYIAAVQSAGGVFNFLRAQNIKEDSHNMRTFEVPGYGGLMITNRTAEQLNFFEEDKEAVYFDSIEELNDKIDFLSRNNAMIEKMKLQAKSRSIRGGYGYSHRSLALFNKLREYL